MRIALAQVDPLFWLALPLALMAYWGGYRVMERLRSSRMRIVALGIALLLALPALLYAAYYTRVLGEALWYYQLRAQPYSELLAAPAGLLFGMACVSLRRYRFFRRATSTSYLALLLVLITVPYAKSLLQPVNLARLEDRWPDGICLQTSGSTCGPASAATLARLYGIRLTERALARESFTSQGGTENWYLARALQRHGLRVDYVKLPAQPASLPYPAIAGVRLGGPDGCGHFIAVLGETPDSYLLADPLGHRITAPKSRIKTSYYFTGFFMRVTRAR